MKIMKYLTMGLLFIGMIALVGCKKEDMSKYATKEDLNNYATNSDLNNSQAKVYNFGLTFGPGITSSMYWDINDFEKGDVIVTFGKFDELVGAASWSQLPIVNPNFIVTPEFDEDLGVLRITIFDGNGNSPFSSSGTIGFKAVLIKSSAIKTHPNIDLSSYEEISKTFSLE